MCKLKIRYEPFHEIIVKEYVRYKNIQHLFYILAQIRATGTPVSLNWARGVIFVHVPLEPSTDELMEDYLKGRLYIANVSFALMPEYKEVVSYKTPQGQEVPIPVINISDSKTLCELAEWLKSQK